MSNLAGKLNPDVPSFVPNSRGPATQPRAGWGSAGGKQPAPQGYGGQQAYMQQPNQMMYPQGYGGYPHHHSHHHPHHQHQHQQHQYQQQQYSQHQHHHQQHHGGQYQRHPSQHAQAYEQPMAHFPSHTPSHTSNTELHHSEKSYVPPGRNTTSGTSGAAAPRQPTQTPRPPQQHTQPTQQLASSVPAVPAAAAPAPQQQQPVPPAATPAPEPAADGKPAPKKWVARGRAPPNADLAEQQRVMEESKRKKKEADAEEQEKREKEMQRRKEEMAREVEAMIAEEEEGRKVFDMNADHDFELLQKDEEGEKAVAQQKYEERLKAEEAARKEAEREAREYDILKWDREEAAELAVEWSGTVLKKVLNDGEGQKNGMTPIIGKTLVSCNGVTVENEEDIAAAIASDLTHIVFKFRKVIATDGLVMPDLNALREQLKRMKMDAILDDILDRVENSDPEEVEVVFRLLKKSPKDTATIAAKSLVEVGFDDSILKGTVVRRINLATTCYLCSSVGAINEIPTPTMLARLKAVLSIDDDGITVDESEYEKAMAEVTEKERKEDDEKRKRAEEDAERVSKKPVDAEAKVDKVEKDDTRDALKKKFMLDTPWSLFFTQAPGEDGKWKEPVVLAKVASMSDLWGVLSQLPLAHTLKENSSFALFRDDIEPTWEHEANQGGGQWRATLEPSGPAKDASIDRCWVHLIMKLAGENFAKSHSLINGVTFEHKWGDMWRMNLWLGRSDPKLYPALGREFKEVAIMTKTLKVCGEGCSIKKKKPAQGDKVKFIETIENKSSGTKIV